jgi:hypothetical protein
MPPEVASAAALTAQRDELQRPTFVVPDLANAGLAGDVELVDADAPFLVTASSLDRPFMADLVRIAPSY